MTLKLAVKRYIKKYPNTIIITTKRLEKLFENIWCQENSLCYYFIWLTTKKIKFKIIVTFAKVFKDSKESWCCFTFKYCLVCNHNPHSHSNPQPKDKDKRQQKGKSCVMAVYIYFKSKARNLEFKYWSTLSLGNFRNCQ